jgi:hypothetical protein
LSTTTDALRSLRLANEADSAAARLGHLHAAKDALTKCIKDALQAACIEDAGQTTLPLPTPVDTGPKVTVTADGVVATPADLADHEERQQQLLRGARRRRSRAAATTTGGSGDALSSAQALPGGEATAPAPSPLESAVAAQEARFDESALPTEEAHDAAVAAAEQAANVGDWVPA